MRRHHRRGQPAPIVASALSSSSVLATSRCGSCGRTRSCTCRCRGTRCRPPASPAGRRGRSAAASAGSGSRRLGPRSGPGFPRATRPAQRRSGTCPRDRLCGSLVARGDPGPDRGSRTRGPLPADAAADRPRRPPGHARGRHRRLDNGMYKIWFARNYRTHVRQHPAARQRAGDDGRRAAVGDDGRDARIPTGA